MGSETFRPQPETHIYTRRYTYTYATTYTYACTYARAQASVVVTAIHSASKHLTASDMEKRIAANGTSYTEQEFAKWYGPQYREWWMRAGEDQAGASEHVQPGEDQAGATEHGQSLADQPDTISSDRAGEEGHALALVPIMLLGMHEVQAIVASALTEGLTRTKLHDEARLALEFVTAKIRDESTTEVDASACWVHWPAYVCMHEEHQTMIGPGIVRVTAQSIQGTKDANRQGRPRVDLVLNQLGGSYVRVHPGRHMINDAALKLSPPSASEHGASATNQWTRIWSGDGVFTLSFVPFAHTCIQCLFDILYDQLEAVPQIISRVAPLLSIKVHRPCPAARASPDILTAGLNQPTALVAHCANCSRLMRGDEVDMRFPCGHFKCSECVPCCLRCQDKD